LPIRRLAEVVREANAGRDEADRCLLVVDGVHGLGAVDEAVAPMGCDFFAAGTHKWMLGPRGTGLVWGRADAWPHVRPTVPSFDATEPFAAWSEGRPLGPQTQAAWVSPGGFYAYEHHWAVEAAVRFHEGLGRARIAARILELNGRFRSELGHMPRIRLHTPASDALSAGIVCFEVEGLEPRQVVEGLRAKRVLATTTPYAVTYARVSAGIMVQPEEIETALRAIRGLAA
ncbi:MAG TPA: aminotransferase class V-fold PLP-dependent enzyme, partial [Vicinamibacteria bacterium]|nr:aminotransferase class V-fold PLP-dependent enzyme [Vicinamibacteria bacterium]